MLAGKAQQPAPEQKIPGWLRKIVSYVLGFVLSLMICAALERVMDKEFLHKAEAAQKSWINTVSHTSPVGVASAYGTKLGEVWRAAGENWYSKSNMIAIPFSALIRTVIQLYESSSFVFIVQIVLGALALAVINFRRSGSVLFEQPYTNLLGLPIAIVFFASLIGGGLWILMVGALTFLGQLTGFAATMAGATGIVGFCWYCVGKLTEKGAEHLVGRHI